eukprot:NODE_15_length_50561_cov_0.608081.p22 type:complete len:306 gc:universal NODE_15_length_50561_cov_0.608081:48889-47972(-)
MVKITIPVGKSQKNKIKISADNLEDGANIPIEKHLILRLPEQLADRVSSEIKDRNYDNIKMEYLNDRQGIFIYQKDIYMFKLVDLPCILETQKTVDKKQFYKSGDISQMILVDEEPFEKEREGLTIDELSARLPDLDRTDYIYPHGLTPPLQHVRQRRFRKRTPKHEIETIEEQVKKLLERDDEAFDVKYEVVEDEDDEMSFENEPSQIIQDNLSDDDSLVADLERELQQERDDSENDDNEVEDLEDLNELNDDILLIKEQIAEKKQQIESAPNAIIKIKLEEALKRLEQEYESKIQEFGDTTET